MIPISDIFKNNSAWSATGDEKFFRALDRLAAGSLRVAFLAQNASATNCIIERTRSAGITTPIILFAKQHRGRFAPHIEYLRYECCFVGHVTADWPDAAIVCTRDGQEHWAIRIVNRQLEIMRAKP